MMMMKMKIMMTMMTMMIMMTSIMMMTTCGVDWEDLRKIKTFDQGLETILVKISIVTILVRICILTVLVKTLLCLITCDDDQS